MELPRGDLAARLGQVEFRFTRLIDIWGLARAAELLDRLERLGYRLGAVGVCLVAARLRRKVIEQQVEETARTPLHLP